MANDHNINPIIRCVTSSKWYPARVLRHCVPSSTGYAAGLWFSCEGELDRVTQEHKITQEETEMGEHHLVLNCIEYGQLINLLI